MYETPQLIDFRASSDARGSLSKVFGRAGAADGEVNLKAFGDGFVLESGKDVFRGLHAQKPPFDQSKAFLVLAGSVEVYAVRTVGGVVEPSSLSVHALTGIGKVGLVVPEGWATGVHTISDSSTVWVSASKPYRPDCEFTISIRALLPFEDSKHWKLSEKDS
jgi:dTDP-4-dehydrorhamnose 3,5-epimerase-like enzyme